MAIDTLRDPWERQPGEPDNAFQAFTFYRDTRSKSGNRNISVAYCRFKGIEGKSATGTWVRWSIDWEWHRRSLAWDDECDRVKRAALSEEIAAMGRRQAQQAVTSAQVLLLPVLALAKKLRDDPNIIDTLSKQRVEDLLELTVSCSAAWKRAIDVERIARGEDTERISLARAFVRMREDELDHFIASGIQELDPGTDRPPALPDQASPSGTYSAGTGRTEIFQDQPDAPVFPDEPLGLHNLHEA